MASERLTELYKKMFGGNSFTPQLGSYTFPNSSASYSAAPAAPTAPLFPPTVTPAGYKPMATPSPVNPAYNVQVPPPAAPAPTRQPAPAPVQQPTVDYYAKYRDPKTGKVMTPQEWAVYLGNKVPKGGLDVQNYAAGAIANPDQTKEQLNRSAYGMNNARNDIATGTTDPYKAGNKSGIAYSPAELSAIEKAYAGIYDPALSDVFSKLDTKAKQEAADLEQKNKLAQMAKQHEYAMAEKGLTLGGTGVAGEYVKGANPAVDAWAQRIFDGTAKITDIPASQKGMRDAVVMALQASGNDLAGKPTVTELGKNALAGAQNLLKKFTDRAGTSAVGGTRIFGGSLAFPGTDKQNFVIDFNNLKDMLSLEGVKYLKGQGQVSDAERRLLADASTKLNLSQSEAEFKSKPWM
jgi:hypothetical protein